jgi:hypothetical protein
MGVYSPFGGTRSRHTEPVDDQGYHLHFDRSVVHDFSGADTGGGEDRKHSLVASAVQVEGGIRVAISIYCRRRRPSRSRDGRSLPLANSSR